MHPQKWAPQPIDDEIWYKDLQLGKSFETQRFNDSKLEQDKDPEIKYANNPFRLASILNTKTASSGKTLNEIINPELSNIQINQILRKTGINGFYENSIEATKTIKQPVREKELDGNSRRPVVLATDIFKEELSSSDSGISELEKNLIKITIEDKNLPTHRRYKTLFDTSERNLDCSSSSDSYRYAYDPKEESSLDEASCSSHKVTRVHVPYKRFNQEDGTYSTPLLSEDDDTSSVWSEKSSTTSTSTCSSSSGASSNSSSTFSCSSGNSSKKGSKKKQYKKLVIGPMEPRDNVPPPGETGLSTNQMYIQRARFH